MDLITPLYEMGVQGIFTRSLDIALLNNQIDLAVHSMKDVPVQLPDGLMEAAVLERDSPFDVLVPHPARTDIYSDIHSPSVIASSSLRRRAQWLHRFPVDQIAPIRGNVNTRLKKLADSEWLGAIFAAAGLQRIGLHPANAIELDWMIPAPAQGAILVVCRDKDEFVFDQCRILHHEQSSFCVKIERDFLSTLLGGCSTPIGALAEMEGDEIFFRETCWIHPAKKIFDREKISIELGAALGISAAHELLSHGGKELIEKNNMSDRRVTILSTASCPLSV
jgi:hydroxymethylbilane synthase